MATQGKKQARRSIVNEHPGDWGQERRGTRRARKERGKCWKIWMTGQRLLPWMSLKAALVFGR